VKRDVVTATGAAGGKASHDGLSMIISYTLHDGLPKHMIVTQPARGIFLANYKPIAMHGVRFIIGVRVRV
jgi:hypothetical protein